MVEHGLFEKHGKPVEGGKVKKNISIAIFVFLAVSIILFAFCSPKHTIEVYRNHSFYVDKEFPDVRRALYRQDFVKEVLEIHDAELVSKKWIRHDLEIRRPLLQESEYSGVMLIVARSKKGYGTLHIEQTVTLRRDEILTTVRLDRPMKVGVTDWDQEIRIVPDGNRTKFTIKLYAKLSRPIPRIFKGYAEEQMNHAADTAVYGLQPLLIEMAMKDVGLFDFSIPLR